MTRVPAELPQELRARIESVLKEVTPGRKQMREILQQVLDCQPEAEIYTMLDVSEELDLDVGTIKRRSQTRRVGQRLFGDTRGFLIFTREEFERLQGRRSTRWTEEEDQQILEAAGRWLNCKDIQRELGSKRSPRSIQIRLRKLGVFPVPLGKPRPRGPAPDPTKQFSRYRLRRGM